MINRIHGVAISGISTAIPTSFQEISSFNAIFGEDTVQKFSEMTGVQKIHRANPEQTAGDLGYEAARDVLTRSGVHFDEIGVLVFITQKPDYRLPSTSYIIHHRLGLSTSCLCLDINLACSGYIIALQTALSLLKSTDKKYGLVITGDTSVRTISPMDRTMIMLFGDSGTCTLIEKTGSDEDIISFATRTDGNRFKSIITPAGAYRNMNISPDRTAWSDEIERSDYDTHMKGMDVFGFSITDVPLLLKDYMQESGTSVDHFDYFILHQANMYILKQISRKLKLPQEKVPVSIHKFGNNSSNSVPLVLSDHFGTSNDMSFRALMSGFGAGLSWAVCDVKINSAVVYPVFYTDEYFEAGSAVL